MARILEASFSTAGFHNVSVGVVEMESMKKTFMKYFTDRFCSHLGSYTNCGETSGAIFSELVGVLTY